MLLCFVNERMMCSCFCRCCAPGYKPPLASLTKSIFNSRWFLIGATVAAAYSRSVPMQKKRETSVLSSKDYLVPTFHLKQIIKALKINLLSLCSVFFVSDLPAEGPRSVQSSNLFSFFQEMLEEVFKQGDPSARLPSADKLVCFLTFILAYNWCFGHSLHWSCFE